MNLRDTILKAEDRKSTTVTIPEWDNITLYIRTMSGDERDAFETSILKDGKVNTEGFRAKLLVRCLVDEHGVRIFRDDETALLGEKSANVLNRLFEIANANNGLSKADQEELLKN